MSADHCLDAPSTAEEQSRGDDYPEPKSMAYAASAKAWVTDHSQHPSMLVPSPEPHRVPGGYVLLRGKKRGADSTSEQIQGHHGMDHRSNQSLWAYLGTSGYM